MSAVWGSAYVLLGGGALLTLIRLWRGPSLLDRVVATETLLAIIASGVAVYAALAEDTTVVPALVVIALLGFLGGVAVARYVGGMLVRSTGDRADGEAPRPARSDGDRG